MKGRDADSGAGMGSAEPLKCPECGEPAVRHTAVDLVPWEAHAIAQPQWSHPDSTALCPVIGRSGYEPAQPQPSTAGRPDALPRRSPEAAANPVILAHATLRRVEPGNEFEPEAGA